MSAMRDHINSGWAAQIHAGRIPCLPCGEAVHVDPTQAASHYWAECEALGGASGEVPDPSNPEQLVNVVQCELLDLKTAQGQHETVRAAVDCPHHLNQQT